MTRVIQVGPLKPSLAHTLTTTYGARALPDAHRDEFLAEHATAVEVAVTSGRTGVGTALMERLPSLGAVVNFGVGYDTTDVELARRRGILVSNTPDVLTDCVADTALGLAIDVVRGLSASDRFVRRRAWPTSGSFPLTHRISGMRVGILGLGRIGRAIATRFEAFGCPIAYHQRTELPSSAYAYVTSPRQLADSVDILIIATAGGAGTRGLVGREELKSLGPDGYLINVARGSVVDQDALVDLLSQGALAGAGLDVFDDEPNVPGALIELDNVVLLPHVGSATVETRAAMEQLTLDNLSTFLETGSLLTPVPEVLR